MKETHRKFLIELQKELNNQQNDGNAGPVFWVIMDYKWETCNPDIDTEERMYVYDSESVWGDEIVSFIKGILDEDEFTKEQIQNGEAAIGSGDWYEMEEWLNENYKNNLVFIPQHVRQEIPKDLMFITKADAKRHLELNQHHYSDKAHTYAMTAWRSPSVEKLWEILRTADFGK